MKHLICCLLLSLSLSNAAWGGADLTVSEEQIELLGIQFAPVRVVDHTTGHHVPATVINSPLAATSVTALFDGILDEWRAAPGEALEKGQVVARLSSQSLLDLQNRFIAARAEVQRAQFEYQKDQRLFESGVIAETRLQKSRQRFETARSNLSAHQQHLTAAGFSPEQTAQFIEQTIPLGVYSLRAPVSGHLAQRHFRTGDYVEAKALVASLQSAQAAWVHARIPVSLAKPLNIGQALVLSSGEQLILRQKNIEVNQSNQLLDIYAEFDTQAPFYAGQLVTLILPGAQEGVLVPASAITRSGSDTRVYVKHAGRIETRSLALEALGDSYLAKSGLQPGELIAIKGTAALKGIELGLGGGE